MSRHVLIGRFGDTDTLNVPKAGDESASSLQLLTFGKRVDHGIGRAFDDLRALGLRPSAVSYTHLRAHET